MKKTPAVVKVKVRSLKMVQSGQMVWLGLGPRRTRMRRLARTRRKRKMKARIRAAHGNPRREELLEHEGEDDAAD